ncbi:MAG TPA: LuxR C-terminal-related transcriptional regulator [Gemmatimonadaceae bacterium]
MVAVSIVDESMAPAAPLALGPLGGVLDLLDEGIVLFRSDSLYYRNAAAEKLLRADTDRVVLTREMGAASRSALGTTTGKTVEVEVGTKAGWYRVRANLLKQRIKEIGDRTVLVTIERARPRLPSPEFLMRSFALTAAEATVALLLARGFQNSKIASDLHISRHTARHHTEKVMTKLNVHCRADVAGAVVSGHPRTASREVRVTSNN